MLRYIFMDVNPYLIDLEQIYKKAWEGVIDLIRTKYDNFVSIKSLENTIKENIDIIDKKDEWINEIGEEKYQALIKLLKNSFDKVIDEYAMNNPINPILSTFFDDAKKENVTDIVLLAKSKQIDIEHFLENNKVRKAAYDALIPTTVDIKDKSQMHKICEALEKLKINIEEYKNYVEFAPLFKDFKDEYEKVLSDNTQKEEYKGLKNISEEIKAKEAELEKINKKIFGSKISFLDFRSESNMKKLKAESLYVAKELYELYKKYDKEYFKDKVLKELDKTLAISDLLTLYYSFDFVKKLAIQRVYNITDYNEIIKYSDTFDLFAMNPLNMIVAGVPIFGTENIARVIANKYRLNNLSIIEDDLREDNLSSMLNKISLILRINMIENSQTSIDKIWFMVQVAKIIDKENKEDTNV